MLIEAVQNNFVGDNIVQTVIFRIGVNAVGQDSKAVDVPHKVLPTCTKNIRLREGIRRVDALLQDVIDNNVFTVLVKIGEDKEKTYKANVGMKVVIIYCHESGQGVPESRRKNGVQTFVAEVSLFLKEET